MQINYSGLTKHIRKRGDYCIESLSEYTVVSALVKQTLDGTSIMYRWKDHVGKVDEGLRVESSIDGEANGREEQKVAEAEQESGGQKVDLRGGLSVVCASPTFVTFKKK